MNCPNSTILTRAVAAICPDIKERITQNPSESTEARLWWELSCCLLSSQVSYTLATAAADALERHGLLLGENAVSVTPAEIEFVLKNEVYLAGRNIVYRFYRSKAEQISRTYHNVRSAAGSLKDLLGSFDDALSARDWFVENAPGLGPKQASMFLRNVGATYELAVIDRHVLKYMSFHGVTDGLSSGVSGMSSYRRHEAWLQQHASDLGFEVGLMDWAIWIVMRVANEINDMETT